MRSTCVVLLLLLTSCDLPSDREMTRTFEKKQPLFEEAITYFTVNTHIDTVTNRGKQPTIVFYMNDTRKEGADAQIDDLLDSLDMRGIWRSRTLAPGGIFFTYKTDRCWIPLLHR